jgi:hypothetical protein
MNSSILHDLEEDLLLRQLDWGMLMATVRDPLPVIDHDGLILVAIHAAESMLEAPPKVAVRCGIPTHEHGL